MQPGGRTFGAQQTYAYPGELDHSRTFHWRIRGHGGTGVDAWVTPWAEGVFITKAAASPPPTPPLAPTQAPPVVIEEKEIAPVWIWVLVAICGLAVVVWTLLIVKTKRSV